jgi:hypothetical protein
MEKGVIVIMYTRIYNVGRGTGVRFQLDRIYVVFQKNLPLLD